jgi:hypothetical protein
MKYVRTCSLEERSLVSVSAKGTYHSAFLFLRRGFISIWGCEVIPFIQSRKSIKIFGRGGGGV